MGPLMLLLVVTGLTVGAIRDCGQDKDRWQLTSEALASTQPWVELAGVPRGSLLRVHCLGDKPPLPPGKLLQQVGPPEACVHAHPSTLAPPAPLPQRPGNLSFSQNINVPIFLTRLLTLLSSHPTPRPPCTHPLCLDQKGPF